ncbi:alpha/beta fold hydrolase [Glaciecola sp. MF2-115]|uniref:alpha/beta fold hydrolase n=1 Tax=Glaciecola sp. MF2-115 TaxID=3384827 RepID=UPI00399F325E
MSIIETNFTMPNLNIAALSNAKNDKPLLLMVHGWLDNAASFAKLIPLLNNFNVIAIDLPGHGKSSHRSPDAHYHLLDYVHDLHCLVKSQGWRDFSIVGHSLGGIISSIYCATFPELVRNFVCIESAGPLTEPEASSVEQLRKAIESRINANEKTIKHPKNLEAIVEARQKVSDLSYENASLLLQRNTKISSSGDDIEWTTDKRLRTVSSLRLTQKQAEVFVKGIQCPTHFILGDKGFSKVKDLMLRREAFFKNAEMSTVEGGHHVHMEAEQQIAKIIMQHCQ